MGIHIGDVVRIIKEPFKGIRRELLAKSGTVINFPVLVINEGCAINAPFLVFPKYHIYSFSGKQAGKLLPAATATVHGKSHFVPNLRLPFFCLILANVVTDTLFQSLIPVAFPDKGGLDGRT